MSLPRAHFQETEEERKKEREEESERRREMLNHKHRFLPNKTSKACLDIIRPTFHVPLVCPNQQSKVFSPSLRLETKLICRFLCVAHFCSFPKQKRKFESQSQSVTQGTPSFPLHSKRKNNSLLEHFTLIEQKLGIQQVLFQLQSISHSSSSFSPPDFSFPSFSHFLFLIHCSFGCSGRRMVWSDLDRST